MTRNDLVKELALRIYGNADVTEMQKCSLFCDTLVDIVKDTIIERDKFYWVGFLSLEVVRQGERRGRDPQSNKVITFPPTNKIKVKLSSQIKELANIEG